MQNWLGYWLSFCHSCLACNYSRGTLAIKICNSSRFFVATLWLLIFVTISWDHRVWGQARHIQMRVLLLRRAEVLPQWPEFLVTVQHTWRCSCCWRFSHTYQDCFLSPYEEEEIFCNSLRLWKIEMCPAATTLPSLGRQVQLLNYPGMRCSENEEMWWEEVRRPWKRSA